MAEVNTAEVEAKVNAAFGEGFGDTPPAPAAKVVEAPVVEPAKPAAAPAPVPEKPQYVRLTKQELDLLKTRVGKVDGLESRVAKFEGSMPKAEQIVQQAIEAIRAQTPSGAKVVVTKEDFAELGEDFGDLSGMTIKGLQRVLDRFNVTGTSAPATVDQGAVTKAVEAVLTGREKQALEKAHPDWREKVGIVDASGKPPADHPFRVWLNAQPAEYQKEINETESPAEVQAAIERFLTDTKPASASPSPKPVVDKAAARRAVIEDAVTPRADGNPPPLNAPQSVDDAFASGFKTAKRH